MMLIFTSWHLKRFALVFQPASNNIEDVLDEESSAGEGSLDGCAGKMCTANEHCCDKHVCVDADESKFKKYDLAFDKISLYTSITIR